MKRVTIGLPFALHRRFMKLKKRNGKDLRYMVEAAAKEYLDKHERLENAVDNLLK